MKEEKKNPITSIAFMAMLLILALVGGYLLGNDDFLKLRTEVPAEITKDEEDLKKLEESKEQIPAEDLYTFEYNQGDSAVKGFFSLFMLIDGDLYYQSISRDSNDMALVRTVDFIDGSERKDLKKVDTSSIGKVRRIKAFLYDDAVKTMLITESGKVYTTSVSPETGVYTPITTVEALKDYEVDNIKNYHVESNPPEASFEIILKNGETVKK